MRIEFGEGHLSGLARENIRRLSEKSFYATAVAWQEAEEFAREWGDVFGYENNVAMASGTAADTGALMALYNHGAKRGDEVIIPSLAWISVINTPLSAGFKPVPVDIERNTLNINPNLIEEKITTRTKAIMPVHTMGKPCEMDKIMEISRRNNLFVIEDSCEAHGAQYRDKFVGQWGNMATFSFYMAHLVWAGEGGMVSTESSNLANSVKAVRNHGREPGSQYMDHYIPGLNLKMSDFHAVIGRAHLKDFWETFDTRKENLAHLMESTGDLEDLAFFGPQEDSPIETVAPHGFSLTLKDPALDYGKLYAFLQKNSINCKRNFGSMTTQHSGFEFLGHKLGEFPEAEYVGDNGLHIGIHQYLKEDDLDYISERLHEYFKR